MNRRLGLYAALTLLLLSLTLSACLSETLQPPAAPASEQAIATSLPAVVTPTLAAAPTAVMTATRATTMTATSVITATGALTATHTITATDVMTPTPASPAKPATAVTVTAPAELQGVTWMLESSGKPAKPVKVLAGTSITALFSADNKVAGSAGCNTYNGTYVASGNELSVGPLAATRKACPQPVMQQEQTYLDALQASRTFEIASDGKLKITYLDGGVLTYGAQMTPTVAAPITPTADMTATRVVTVTTAVTATGAISVTPSAPNNGPTAIVFDAGTTTTQVSGQVKPGGSVPYTLDAKAGQKLIITVNADGPMRVAIAAPQGQLIGVAEASAPWAGSLPATGEYRLTVQAPVDIKTVSYTLEISLR